MLIAQAVALDEKFNLADYEFAVVTLEEDSGARSIGASEKAIQTIENMDGTIMVTTIIPFTVTEEGLVNSFEYSASSAKGARAGNPTYTVVNMTLTLQVSYDKYTFGARPYYRHRGVIGYWNSDDSAALVYSLGLDYKSVGDEYNYPACQSDHNGSLSQADKAVESSVYVDMPEKGVAYSKFDIMPSDKVLYMATYQHGGEVYITMEYLANGVSDTFYTVYLAYSKVYTPVG